MDAVQDRYEKGDGMGKGINLALALAASIKLLSILIV
jgi:hypothetical protein